MADVHNYTPQRRIGFFFHLAAIGLLLFCIVYALWQAARAESNLAFLTFLLPAVISGALLPLFGYRLYGLQTGSYSLARDGIRLRWGLRVEDIPANEVEWIGHERKFSQPLPRPVFAWPGSVVGVRRLSDGRTVEFFAARSRNLALIATPRRVFAISPADPGDFILTYQRLMEYGSLSPLQAQSVYPGFLLRRFQADLPGRLLLLGNILLSLGLFLLVALAIPNQQQVALRFTPQGQPADYVPAVRLFLLPVLNLLFLLADDVLGVFFYRRPELQPLSYLLWGTGVMTSGLFLAALLFILRIG